MSIIGSYPTILTNGTVEDATQVMSLFSWVQSQVNGNSCPATIGTIVLKGDGSGGTTAAVPGTDYLNTAFGQSQVWALYPSRRLTYVYMNGNSLPKMISVTLAIPPLGVAYLTVGGMIISVINNYSSSNFLDSAFVAVVPPTLTYFMSWGTPGPPTIQAWAELG